MSDIEDILQQRQSMTLEHIDKLKTNAEQIAERVVPYAFERGFKRIDRVDDPRIILIGKKSKLKKSVLVVDLENSENPLYLNEGRWLGGLNYYLKDKDPHSWNLIGELPRILGLSALVAGVLYIGSSYISADVFPRSNDYLTRVIPEIGFASTFLGALTLRIAKRNFAEPSPVFKRSYTGEAVMERLSKYSVDKRYQTPEQTENIKVEETENGETGVTENGNQG